MRLHTKKRRAMVAVLVALCLTVLASFVAIAIDGGMLQHTQRITQATADAAALAAAEDLYANWRIGLGLDPNGTAKAKALAVAAANGSSNDLVNSKVTVNIPPLSGPFTGKAGYAEVIVENYLTRGFSSIWGGDKLTVRSRAVAIGQWLPSRNGIIVLDPSSPGSLTDNGGGTISVVGADILVDSNSPSAATATGGGSVSAPNFWVTGVPGISTSGSGTFNGNIFANQVPTPDPLAYLPEPDPTTMVLQSNNPTHASSLQTLNLQPGVYKGGIQVTGQASLNMAPGIYYMDGGGFSFTGQGNLNAVGVMIFMNPKSNSDNINIGGTGQIIFSPPTSGIYQGIALWQERSSTNTVTIAGGGSSQITGTFYAQHGTLSVSGGGTQDVLGSQYISYDVTLGGNGNFNIAWNDNETARTRRLYLVE
jgi:hypothetical protein